MPLTVESLLEPKHSANCITVCIRNDNGSDYRRIAHCLDDAEVALRATALILVMARLNVTDAPRANLQTISEVTTTAANITIRANAENFAALSMNILDPAQARLYCRVAPSYEPLVALAIAATSLPSDQSNRPEATGLAGFRLRRALSYLEAHITGPSSLEDLATEVEMSRFHVCRMFKRSIGVAPHQWVLRRRIELAKDMILQSEASLTEIAYQLGFSNQAHFTTVFRRLAGTTPKQWRLCGAPAASTIRQDC